MLWHKTLDRDHQDVVRTRTIEVFHLIFSVAEEQFALGWSPLLCAHTGVCACACKQAMSVPTQVAHVISYL